MFEYLMLGDIRAQKYLKTGARTCSILKKFAFNTTLLIHPIIGGFHTSILVIKQFLTYHSIISKI